MENSSKYQRFEIKAEDSSNKWDLSSELATYLNKYFINHISEKDFREKILFENPAPSNIKPAQIPDDSIKELLLENKKNYTLNHGKVSKGAQEKMTVIVLFSTQIVEHNGERKKSNSCR